MLCVLVPTEGGQVNNNVGGGLNMGQQHPYPGLSQLAHVYEQQQQQNKDLNKYASLKAVGECLTTTTTLLYISLLHTKLHAAPPFIRIFSKVIYQPWTENRL